MHSYTCNNPSLFLSLSSQRSEARQNNEHTFKWITFHIQQHAPWLADVQNPNDPLQILLLSAFPYGAAMFYTTYWFFLRLITFNSESYSVHVVSLCVHVRAPFVRMRQLGGGGYFTSGRSLFFVFRLITQKKYSF